MTPEQLADRIAIEDLLTRYVVAVDTKDWTAYRSVFTEDAVIDYTSSGGIRGDLETVIAWVSTALTLFPITQHLTTNLQLSIDGDTAKGRCYFFNPLVRPAAGGAPDVLFVGGRPVLI